MILLSAWNGSILNAGVAKQPSVWIEDNAGETLTAQVCIQHQPAECS